MKRVPQDRRSGASAVNDGQHAPWAVSEPRPPATVTPRDIPILRDWADPASMAKRRHTWQERRPPLDVSVSSGTGVADG